MKTNPFINYAKTKRVSLFSVLFLTAFLTVGFPENITTDHWQLYNIFDVPNDWRRPLVAVITLVIIGFTVGQMFNEYKRGTK